MWRWPVSLIGTDCRWQSWFISSSTNQETLAPLQCRVSTYLLSVHREVYMMSVPSVAVLTFRIKHLTEHVKRNRKVNSQT